MKSKRIVITFGALLAVPVAFLLITNTFFGPQTRGEQARELFEAAKVSESHGRADEAVERLRLALKFGPRDVEIHRHYQNLMRKRGRLDEARTEYQSRLDDKDALSHYLYGRLLEGEDVERELRKALELDETLWVAHAGLGHYLFDKRDYVNCVPHLGMAFAKLKEKDLGTRLAEAYMRQGNMEAAAVAWEDVKRDFPAHPDGWYGQGTCFQFTGNHKLAIEMFEQALKLDPGHWRCRLGLFQSLNEAREWERAGRLIEESRGRRPKDAEPCVRVGVMDVDVFLFIDLDPEPDLYRFRTDRGMDFIVTKDEPYELRVGIGEIIEIFKKYSDGRPSYATVMHDLLEPIRKK